MADPTMNDNVGIPILGQPSNKIFKNIIDCDMSKFYPAIKISSNMDPITLIGKVIFQATGESMNQEFIDGNKLNRSLNQVYHEKDKNGDTRSIDSSGEAISTFLSGNILTACYNWLGLPSVTEMYMLVERELGS
jgi:hypothetical protein